MNLARQFESYSEIKDYLSKSIFVISIGSNDYLNNYLQPDIYASSLRYSPQSFAKLLNDALFQHLQVNYFSIQSVKTVLTWEHVRLHMRYISFSKISYFEFSRQNYFPLTAILSTYVVIYDVCRSCISWELEKWWCSSWGQSGAFHP